MCSPDLAPPGGPPVGVGRRRPWVMPTRSKVQLYEQIRRSYERSSCRCERWRDASVSTDVTCAMRWLHRCRRSERWRSGRHRRWTGGSRRSTGGWRPTGGLHASSATPRGGCGGAGSRSTGAQVGESTVRRYVAEARWHTEVPLVEVMVPQHHPLGEEAEVDFGTARPFTWPGRWWRCRCS